MGLVMTSGPAGEPVSTADAKTFLRVDGTAEDILIGSLVLTSRLHIEAALGLALITQSWRLVLDAWPSKGDHVPLPLHPVQSVTAVRTRTADGTPVVASLSDFLLDTSSRPARLVRKGVLWPQPGQAANGIEIEFTAGFGSSAADVPAPIRQALVQLIAHWYEHRDPIEVGSMETEVPGAVSKLLAPWRGRRL